jgi:hypothetical protein
MDPEVKYLLSLGAVRDRAKLVGEAAQAGKLTNFDVHEDKLGGVAEYVTSVIKVCHLCHMSSNQSKSTRKLTMLSTAGFRPQQLPHDPPARPMAALRSRQRPSRSRSYRRMEI